MNVRRKIGYGLAMIAVAVLGITASPVDLAPGDVVEPLGITATLVD